MNKIDNKFELLVDNNLYTYNVKSKRGFSELLEEIKLKYGVIKEKEYHSGYFDNKTMKFKIIDYGLQNYDELNVKSCRHISNYTISNGKYGTPYQAYSGDVEAIIYPEIYKILNNEISTKIYFDSILLMKLSNWYNNNNNISKEKKYNIISEVLEYLDFELINIENYKTYIQVKDSLNYNLKEKIKKLESVNQLLNNSNNPIKDLLYAKINSDMEKHYKKKITDKQYTKKIIFSK